MKATAEETDALELAEYFHSLYQKFHLRKNERKQVQRRDKAHRPKARQRTKTLLYSSTAVVPLEVPRIEILGNCSPFSAYASVRQLVLEVSFAEESKKWLIASDERDNENDNASERLPSPVSLPKVIGIGLETVFQLVKESHVKHSSLCVKALEALLNILGGQYPQSLKKEPIPVIDSLFATLLNLSKYKESEIATSSSRVSKINSEPLTSIATACLISLAIARGETKMMLEAISSLFMCSDHLANQTFESPDILKALQRSTHAILVGRPILPQWLTHGIPSNSCVDSFPVSFPSDPPGSVFSAKSLATDGRFLFLHCSRGIYKIGSGCFGTERGYVYASDPNFHLTEKVWIGWASGKLFYRLVNCGDSSLRVLDENTFEVKETIKTMEDGSVTMFSDGVHVGAIVPSKDDGFVARTVWMETANMSWDTFFEVNLRLVKKSLEASGPCPWDNESSARPIATAVDEDVATICAGKDFALLRTQHGRILYCGKGASLGQKSGITKCSKWLELGLTKCPRFIQCAVGHEGIHALLLTEDGTTFFVGTPKRGEDGDQAKPRRVAKASKPKKVIRMEGHDVSFVACNNGTSAFVTRTGDVYMFGKDTTHCDLTTGFLIALRGVFVSQLAMGKAHSVILSTDGKVYTMGINNRGQCGRTWSPHKEGATDVLEDDEGEWDDGAANAGVIPPEQEGICPAGSHRWKHEQCMICTICRECTGYGSACISALRPDRNPGQECGCGVGDAGCAECGSCRTCAREGIEEQDYVIIDAQRGLDPAAGDLLQLEEERIASLEEANEKRSVKATPKATKSRGKESSMTSFPPSRLNLPTSFSIIQVACGLHHSVVLDANGTVFVCGSNSFGQLGLGDLSPRHSPQKLRFPDSDTKIIQIAAGSYHTVALDYNGVVYTCGSHTKGQLAREPEENKTDPFWFAKMAPLSNVGSKFGRRATWINAAGDATLMKLEVSLISPKLLQKSTVTANSSAIMIIPPLTTGKNAAVIMINRKDGCCTYFEGEKHLGVTTTAATLDPVYDFLWTYEWRTHLMRCYNVIASAIRNSNVESNLWLTKPPFAIPVSSRSDLQRWQAGANLLACMDSLVAANVQGLSVHHEEQAVVAVLSKMYSRDDYSAVCRFESHGGGWGYSGHSIEAIRFSCDSDVLVGGLGLFGGRGEYCAKIKIFDIGPEGSDVEGDGELLAETEEVPYECGPRQKHRMMFEDPIPVQAGRWYVAWAHISGPSSDCGSSGQGLVVTEDQVTFHFKSSKKSNNGTDVNAGQIPQILYRLMTSDQSSLGTKPKQQVEPTYLLTNDFISNFSPPSIQILMRLIKWCWEEMKTLCSFTKVDVFKAELMQFVSCCCLRLVEFSINQAYPAKGCGRLSQMENASMAEAVGDVRATIQSMISCQLVSLDSTIDHIAENILNQTCKTFVNCFQIFYPTSVLKWECMANFMHSYFEDPDKFARILSAILEALSFCRGHLLGVFPVLTNISREIQEDYNRAFILEDDSPKSRQPAKNRVLVSQMTARNDVEGFQKPQWSFWDVLESLLSIINRHSNNTKPPIKALVHNSSMILARLMEELVSHASGAYAELESVIGQTVVVTPCRFTRTNQSRTWNTGNGSPDAVSFTIDQSGVTIFGACIYSGTGNYEYELDLLQELDESTVENCDQPNSKWSTLEVTRGSFDSDDSYGDVSEIKFPRPVHIKPGVKYAIRLKNHGGRTCNGDGGITVLRCSDGTIFTFSSCSLSFNGTNQIRGQIPHILYFRNPEDSEAKQKAKAVGEMQARECAQKMSNAIFDSAKQVFLLSAASDEINELPKCSLVTTLLPSILAHLPRLAVSDLRSCVDLLEQIRRLLPSVSDLNNKITCEEEKRKGDNLIGAVHFSWVESEHPYKPATVSHYRVNFPPSVQIMAIEFDPRCSTAQAEDNVRLYIPRRLTSPCVPTNKRLNATDSTSEDHDIYISFIAILEKYSGRENWPKKAVILPGNEVLFSLETASDYTRADKDHYFGFRCLVSGFEVNQHEGLQRLEMELAYLGGLCAYELIKKDLVLPPVSAEEVEASLETMVSEEKMMEICIKHHQLFAKGIGLEYFPDVQEALDGIVPLREKSKEQEFVTNFVARTPNTSGERLANWLQPESFVDPQKCEIIIPQESIRRGKPASFTIVTRDQYSEPVVAHNLQVEVKAIPMMISSEINKSRGGDIRILGSNSYPEMTTICSSDSLTPKTPDNVSTLCPRQAIVEKSCIPGKIDGTTTVPYQVTVKDKMRYHSITMMKEYENMSFEELRLLSPLAFRSSESMLVRQSNNGNYTATWTPSCTGPYHLSVTVDGYAVSETCVVDVEEGSEKAFSAKLPDATEISDNQFMKKRKFRASDSAGLRIRSHPSLQSEQIGCVPINGIIGFSQEVHNDDGIWVKLDESSLYAFCESNQTRNFRLEGWCLQYNQHVGKTLLFPVEGPKRLCSARNQDKGLVNMRRLNDPSLPNSDNSSKILRLNGSHGLYQVVKCGVSGHNIRSRPCLRSPPVGILVMGSKFHVVDECFNNEGLWVKLDHPSQRKFCFTSEGEAWSLAVGHGEVVYLRHLDGSNSEKGYDFSIASQVPQNVFQNVSPPAAFVGPADVSYMDFKSPTVFGSSMNDSEKDRINELIKGGPIDQSKSNCESITSLGSSPVTAASPSSIPPSPQKVQQERSSSRRGSEQSNVSDTSKSSKSKSSTPLGALQKWLQIGSESRQNSISSSSTMKQATSVMEASKSLVKERIGAFSGGDKAVKTVPQPTTTCSATQTSPDEQNMLSPFNTGLHFNIGSAGTPVPSQGINQTCLERATIGKSTPKSERKKRGSSKTRSSYRERLRSPPRPIDSITSFGTPIIDVPFKEAIGPGQAQSLRAVFGAVLSHNGIVHDAMACAFYLRFIKKDTFDDKKDDITTTNNVGEQSPSEVIQLPPTTTTTESSGSFTEVNKSPVVMRKKQDSPARNKSWQRHSLEVTTPARYLRDTSCISLKPLDSSSVVSISSMEPNISMEEQVENMVDVTTLLKDEEITDSSKEQLPLAMTALVEVWRHVKASCADIVFNEGVSPGGITELKGNSSKWGKESAITSDRRYSHSYGGVKIRNDRSHYLQITGRSFLLDTEDEVEFKDEMQRCEICQAGFRAKAKSRKAHFGLSSLCDNCSERQLKMKKRQHFLGKNSTTFTFSNESKLRYFCQDAHQYSYSSLLNNALFLLQITNTMSESQPQEQSSPIVQKTTFSCLKAFGISESQVLNDDDTFYELKSPTVTMRKFEEAKLLKEKRSISAASASFPDEEWDPITKRRKASNGDQITDETLGYTLLNYPSASLQKLLTTSTSGTTLPETEAIRKMCSTVLAFVTERHDLNSLKLYLFQAIRRVTCRSYGMQVLAWLLRNVSQPTALHDVLWWYASSLEFKGEDDLTIGKAGLDNGWWQMRFHPLTESPSTIFPLLSESFYSLMQTIADIMPYLPVGSPLLEMAVKCWGVCFTRKDHRFLHKSKIFRNLSKIMSQFDGEIEWSKTSSILQTDQTETQGGNQVTTCLTDLTPATEVKVSSRAALCSSLTDESTETFWESGDEDRNRTKNITIISTCEGSICVAAVHVDNGRDTQYKVSSIAVKAGTHPDECAKIGHVELDSRHCGWSWFPIKQENVKVIKIELKGPDNTLRIRQVKVLGISDPQLLEKSTDRNLSITSVIPQRKCENETLRIFRLLSSEVFGKFLYGMKRGESDVDGNDLQEHVVGILFSRNKLTHLQKQVCSHIVSAIHREAIKIKEEMDSQLTGSVLEATNENIRMISADKPRIPDRYCFEMLTLVLALADHKLGRSYLSQQSNLIQDLMQLFHSGTPRIQRQVIAVIRKILPEINPEDFSKIVCLHDVTTGEANLGVLDMFFGCILKSLQVKVRGSQDGNRSAKNISIHDILITEELPSHYWFFRGEGDLQLANSVVSLIKDMCEASFSKVWSPITKSAIGDAVLYLTKIEEKYRRATECLNSPRFWIALAALSTLHPDHSKLLSSPVFMNGNSGRTKCVNHDDGETLAVIQCNDCEDLCTECDRILHLPKKNWAHVRKVCKEEEESIKVDLHEGCGRIKLFWLMALVDSSTLKALVEFRNGMPKTTSESTSALATVGRCRFCNKVGNSGPLALGNVCGDTECQDYSKIACERILECGHLCGGVRNEVKCLPCLQGCSDKPGTILKQDGDDMCMICFTDALAFAPAIQLSCGHVFHYQCCRSILENKWAGPRISFSFSFCPICKVQMAHALLYDVLHPIRELYEDVRRKALMRLEYEGLNQADEIASPGGRYYQDPAGYSMERYAYYVCFKCKKAYFGGEARCDVEMQLEFDPTELLCGGCSDVSQAQLCPKHGTDYLEYKCRYCCSVAVFFCFGTTHFCTGCHDDFQRITAIPKHQLPHCPAGPRSRQLEGEECPLHVSHPPTGEEFALGCGICRNAHTF